MSLHCEGIMRKILLIVACFLMIGCAATPTKHDLEVTAKLDASLKKAMGVPKKEWVISMDKGLQQFCANEAFRAKYPTVTDKQCYETAGLAAQHCLETYLPYMPDYILYDEVGADWEPESSEHWGLIIGKCVGQVFYIGRASAYVGPTREFTAY
jgi:hypothetical protein